MTPQEFVAKWRAISATEKKAYQEHFIDLCRLVGHPTPLEEDPSGTTFAFEAGAGKLGGGSGWADVWNRGCFATQPAGPERSSAEEADAHQPLQPTADVAGYLLPGVTQEVLDGFPIVELTADDFYYAGVNLYPELVATLTMRVRAYIWRRPGGLHRSPPPASAGASGWGT